MTSYRAEVEFALELASECGAIALAYHEGERAALETEEKANNGGLVTRADREIDARLVSAIRERFPDDAVLAEESAEGSDRLQKDRCWMIDPVDGTKEFASRDPSWAIHIGLCLEGRPVMGVVAQPTAERVSWGVVEGEDAGAWTRYQEGPVTPVRPSGRRRPELRLVSSKSHSSPRTLKVLELLEVADSAHLRTGSTGVKISLVARGEADIYAHPTRGTKLWDGCAPQALIEGAGGRLTDVFGKPLRYLDDELGNLRGLLATSGPIHQEVVDVIGPFVEEWFSLKASGQIGS